jgi:hypothetical protein
MPPVPNEYSVVDRNRPALLGRRHRNVERRWPCSQAPTCIEVREEQARTVRVIANEFKKNSLSGVDPVAIPIGAVKMWGVS